MCYSNPSHFFTLQQLRATTQAGGVSGVVLKAQGDAFFIEIEMRSGHHAVLVTARSKEPRRFKNPMRALAILRDIGIVNGRFDLSLYAPEQLNTSYELAEESLFANSHPPALTATEKPQAPTQPKPKNTTNSIKCPKATTKPAKPTKTDKMSKSSKTKGEHLQQMTLL